MKKKISALLLTLALFCSFSIYCSAASKPAVEVMWTHYYMDSVGGVSPSIYYRNNTGKVIKYIDWTVTPYNAVDDPVRCTITGNSTMTLRVVGPVYPIDATVDVSLYDIKKNNVAEDSPFRYYIDLGYWINDGAHYTTLHRKNVYSDVYGNLFSYTGESYSGSEATYTYLTDEEAQNALYTDYVTYDVCWYNSIIDYFGISKAVVTFMDGTKTTISGSNLYTNNFNHTLTNKPFKEQLDQYSAVYNYKEYVQYNQDLVAAFGENQKAWFEHFINSGMKEGRQGSSEFSLAAYKTNNPDLVALFGDDNVKYYEHFIAGGKAEGRIAS